MQRPDCFCGVPTRRSGTAQSLQIVSLCCIIHTQTRRTIDTESLDRFSVIYHPHEDQAQHRHRKSRLLLCAVSTRRPGAPETECPNCFRIFRTEAGPCPRMQRGEIGTVVACQTESSRSLDKRQQWPGFGAVTCKATYRRSQEQRSEIVHLYKGSGRQSHPADLNRDRVNTSLPYYPPLPPVPLILAPLTGTC